MSNNITNHSSDLNVHHFDKSHRELASLPGERSGMGYQHIELKKGMKIASMNVNGLRSHLDEIKLLIRSLHIHILALNVTNITRNSDLK